MHSINSFPRLLCLRFNSLIFASVRDEYHLFSFVKNFSDTTNFQFLKSDYFRILHPLNFLKIEWKGEQDYLSWNVFIHIDLLSISVARTCFHLTFSNKRLTDIYGTLVILKASITSPNIVSSVFRDLSFFWNFCNSWFCWVVSFFWSTSDMKLRYCCRVVQKELQVLVTAK